MLNKSSPIHRLIVKNTTKLISASGCDNQQRFSTSSSCNSSPERTLFGATGVGTSSPLTTRKKEATTTLNKQESRKSFFKNFHDSRYQVIITRIFHHNSNKKIKQNRNGG